ncbi:MAG: hypothetical protein P4L50_01225 [Anaerolineaceae bacterium]|nr:hypothetical protein [Anaerolineaceae bacterium]
MPQHEAFKAKVNEYRTKVEKGHVETSLQGATFLKDWLLNHILVEEKNTRLSLRQKGFLGSPD